jgi:hypothetical protein
VVSTGPPRSASAVSVASSSFQVTDNELTSMGLAWGRHRLSQHSRVLYYSTRVRLHFCRRLGMTGGNIASALPSTPPQRAKTCSCDPTPRRPEGLHEGALDRAARSVARRR